MAGTSRRAGAIAGALPLAIGLGMLTLDISPLFGLAVAASAPAVAIRNGLAGRRPTLTNLPIQNYDVYDVVRILSLATALGLAAMGLLG
jgi:hypothetical protein